MFGRIRIYCVSFLVATCAIVHAGSGASAQDAGDAIWHVSKSSGDVWVTTSAVQQASLTDQATVKPGDSIRTGRNGRVLLVRGEETILIAPNSIIGVPGESKSSTTILQQAGSILLEVEKRNVKHFAVETPYLVAAVKGTRFRVSVNRDDVRVDVHSGEVEVTDFKSGQYALVLPGQAAKASARGPLGLSLSGAGTLSPIRQGEPRPSSVDRVPVPRGGLPAPRSIPDGRQVRALGNPNATVGRGHASAANGALRIAAPLGEVKLNVQKVTKGLARAATTATSVGSNAAKDTVWSSGELTPGNGASKAYGQGNSNGNANGNAYGLGNGNANANANGNANGNAFFGQSQGNAKGNNGNGNGKGKGKGKS